MVEGEGLKMKARLQLPVRVPSLTHLETEETERNTKVRGRWGPE